MLHEYGVPTRDPARKMNCKNVITQNCLAENPEFFLSIYYDIISSSES